MTAKKSSRLKAVAGTIRPGRDKPLAYVEEPLEEVPEPPDWLPNTHAIKEWDRLGAILVANGLLTSAALSMFARLCALHGKLVQKMAAGETPTGFMLAQIRNLENDFCIPPMAASKVGLGEKKKANKFDSNKKRPT